jgi:hypothetical protein
MEVEKEVSINKKDSSFIFKAQKSDGQGFEKWALLLMQNEEE